MKSSNPAADKLRKKGETPAHKPPAADKKAKTVGSKKMGTTYT